MNSHVDMKKKHGYSHYIVLQCKGCDWKYSFNSSKKQGQSFEINVRAVLAFRESGRRHNATMPISARL
jgi:RNase P subunit RPR2